MSEVTTVQRTRERDVETDAPFRWPDASSTAEVVLEEGLAFCAEKAGLESTQTVVQRLREGDCAVLDYWRYGLAKKLGECIGTLDDHVKAAYVLDYDATPLDSAFGTKCDTTLIHLIVWATRRTDALDALLKALDRALVQEYADMVDAPHLKHLLDVQVVDDADVEDRRGYGALLTSLHNRPIRVWER
ncbi:MAG: hypothetical protein ACOC8C_02365 [Chloroflexota bacterium]